MSAAQHRPAVLVVFCRRPAIGTGKQRLAAEIGTAQAAEIATLLLATTLEDARSWPGPVVLAPSEAEDADWAATLLPRSATIIPQTAGNLGERLQGIDCRVRATQPGAVIYVGSDAPVLSEADYAAARKALMHHDVVLAPALDGGVTLMGARCPWPELAGLPWSSDQLCAALAAHCVAQGLDVATLQPVRYDVDLATDLQRLCADLRTDVRPARRILYRKLCSLGYSPG
ncbi:MAG: glycosyltransferase [Gammaproteobacteria bacterium]|nr:glycosyltransferase [Gammaproteobacteria bacterium]